MADLAPNAVTSRQDLAAFIRGLRADLQADPDGWENPTLERFLDAMAAWVADSSDEHMARLGMQTPEPAAWRLVAAALYAARIYE